MDSERLTWNAEILDGGHQRFVWIERRTSAIRRIRLNDRDSELAGALYQAGICQIHEVVVGDVLVAEPEVAAHAAGALSSTAELVTTERENCRATKTIFGLRQGDGWGRTFIGTTQMMVGAWGQVDPGTPVWLLGRVNVCNCSAKLS